MCILVITNILKQRFSLRDRETGLNQHLPTSRICKMQLVHVQHMKYRSIPDFTKFGFCVITSEAQWSHKGSCHTFRLTVFSLTWMDSTQSQLQLLFRHKTLLHQVKFHTCSSLSPVKSNLSTSRRSTRSSFCVYWRLSILHIHTMTLG